MSVFESLAILEAATVLRAPKATAVSKTQPREIWQQRLRGICQSPALEASSRPSATSNTYGHPAQLWRQTIQEKKKPPDCCDDLDLNLILRRSDCDVWETKEKPKVRALMFQNRDGLYVVGQLRWGNAEGTNPRR
jgi:hypothetical protein